MKITDSAKKEILKQKKYLRITVEIGGCDGFQYDLDYVEEIPAGFEVKESLIVTDEASWNMIKDIELEYKDELGYAEFKITNPNAKKGCGCGNSFSLF